MDTWDFDAVRLAAFATWNDALSSIQMESPDPNFPADFLHGALSHHDRANIIQTTLTEPTWERIIRHTLRPTSNTTGLFHLGHVPAEHP